MNIYAIPPFIVGVAIIFLGIFVLQKNKKAPTNTVFSLLCLSLSIWLLCYSGAYASNNEESALEWFKIGLIGIIFVPIFIYHFILIFLNIKSKILLPILYFSSIPAIVFSRTDLLYSNVVKHSWGYYPVAGRLYVFLLLLFVMLFIRGIISLYASLKKTKGSIHYQQTKYVLIGFSFGIFGVSDYLLKYNIGFYPFGYLASSGFILTIAYAIIRYRLMDITFAFKKGTVYSTGLLLTLAPATLLILWGERYFLNSVNLSFSIFLISIIIISAIIFHKIKTKTESALEDTLFYKKYNPYKVLSNFTKGMVSVLTLDELLDRTINTFVETLKIKKASIFLFDEEKKAYIIKTSYGLDEEKNKLKISVRLAHDEKQEDALLSYFLEKREVAIREEIERYPSTQQTQEMIKILKDMESEIAIPFMEKDKIVGFCNLSAKGDRSMYNHEDIELFLSLGRQAAIAIKNAQLVERIKESKHIIRRMERLKTIGDMAAGLAHEIRNPLVPIKTCLDLMSGEHGVDIESIKKIRGCALKEVERIESLLNEIMDYSRPRMPVLKENNINDIVEKTVIFIEYEAKKTGIKIDRKYDNSLPNIMVDSEQMKQVLLNLLINAIDAVDNNGKISIATQKARHMLSPSGKIGEREYVQITVTDNGVGIPEENIERIFNPFYTTKYASKEREGTGLGLSIVQEIITEHHGFIQVRSELGKGSSFLVNLPVEMPEFKLREDRRMLEANKKSENITLNIKYPEEPFQIIQ